MHGAAPQTKTDTFRLSRRHLADLRAALGDRGRDLDDERLEQAGLALLDAVGTALLVLTRLSTDHAGAGLDEAEHGRDA